MEMYGQGPEGETLDRTAENGPLPLFVTVVEIQ